MRLCKFLSFLLITLFCTQIAYAKGKDLSVSVSLADIKTIKSSESRGDELYFDITYYSSLGTSKDERLPAYPKHWLSKQTNSIKDVTLWKYKLKEGESIKLIISLLEEDLPPWDAEGLLGSAELILENQNGVLKKEWTVPIFDETLEVEMQKPADPQRYVFKGESSKYDVAFRIQQKS